MGPLDAFVRKPLQRAEIPPGDGSAGEMPAGKFAPFAEEFVEFVHVVSLVRELGESVQCGLVASVGEIPQSIAIGLTDGLDWCAI